MKPGSPLFVPMLCKYAPPLRSSTECFSLLCRTLTVDDMHRCRVPHAMNGSSRQVPHIVNLKSSTGQARRARLGRRRPAIRFIECNAPSSTCDAMRCSFPLSLFPFPCPCPRPSRRGEMHEPSLEMAAFGGDCVLSGWTGNYMCICPSVQCVLLLLGGASGQPALGGF